MILLKRGPNHRLGMAYLGESAGDPGADTKIPN